VVCLANPMRNSFAALLTVTLVLILGISCKGLLSDEPDVPDDQPPVVRVISPIDGATLFADTLSVSLHIVDESPICEINFYIHSLSRVGLNLSHSWPGEPTDRTFEMSFKTTAGQHSVEGEARDCHGNVGRSPSVSGTLVH